MGFFQVPDDRNLFHTESQLKTWPVSKAGYRLFTTGNGGEEKIGIELNQTIELALVVDPHQVFGSLHSSNLGFVEPGIVGSPTAKPVRIKLAAKGAGTADIPEFDATVWHFGRQPIVAGRPGTEAGRSRECMGYLK